MHLHLQIHNPLLNLDWNVNWAPMGQHVGPRNHPCRCSTSVIHKTLHSISILFFFFFFLFSFLILWKSVTHSFGRYIFFLEKFPLLMNSTPQSEPLVQYEMVSILGIIIMLGTIYRMIMPHWWDSDRYILKICDGCGDVSC